MLQKDIEKATRATLAAKDLRDALLDLNRSENPLISLIVLPSIKDAHHVMTMLESLVSSLKSRPAETAPAPSSQGPGPYTRDHLCDLLPLDDEQTLGHWDNPVAATQYLNMVIYEIRATHPHETADDLINAVVLCNAAKAEYARTNGDMRHVLTYVRKKLDRYKARRPCA